MSCIINFFIGFTLGCLTVWLIRRYLRGDDEVVTDYTYQWVGWDGVRATTFQGVPREGDTFSFKDDHGHIRTMEIETVGERWLTVREYYSDDTHLPTH